MGHAEGSHFRSSQAASAQGKSPTRRDRETKGLEKGSDRRNQSRQPKKKTSAVSCARCTEVA